jgi:hypothetical protein
MLFDQVEDRGMWKQTTLKIEDGPGSNGATEQAVFQPLNTSDSDIPRLMAESTLCCPPWRANWPRTCLPSLQALLGNTVPTLS